MPAYSFEALQTDGKTRTGTLEAASAKAARSLLRQQALVPLQVERLGVQQAQSRAWPGRRRALNATQLAIWTRQLAGLVGSELPLERALTALADEADGEQLKILVAALKADVNAGASLATAMRQHPGAFSDVYTGVIAAGEQGGRLAQVLERLADDLEDRQALKAKLIGAALYPAIVTVVATLIVIFLVSYVVPQVAAVFTGTERSLPMLTVVMLAISDFVRRWGWWLLAAGILSMLALQLSLRRPAFRQRFDAGWLRLPLVGRLSQGYNAARFAAVLAMLAGAGVPILRALQAAADTLANQAMRADAQQALVLVREGAPLASALAQQKRFPRLLVMFISLGEQTGRLPLMLERSATQLSGQVQRRAMQLATVLEPLLIVFMGLIVMLIVLAVMLPIIQLNDWVQ